MVLRRFSRRSGLPSARGLSVVFEVSGLTGQGRLPVVTSAARAQMPLSTTSDRVAILPASYETGAEQLHRLLSDFDTVILMKVGPVLPQILETLAEMDLLGSTLYAERVGMPEERLAFGPELDPLRNERRPYLSLLIVRGSRTVPAAQHRE